MVRTEGLWPDEIDLNNLPVFHSFSSYSQPALNPVQLCVESLRCTSVIYTVFPSLVPFSFVLSFRLVGFRLFLVSPSSLFFSLPCFPWWRLLLLCYFVSALHPPALLASLKYAHFPCVLSFVFFLAFLMLIYLFFLLFLPFFRFRFGHRLFHPVFFLWVLCCLLGFGFCCDSFGLSLIHI